MNHPSPALPNVDQLIRFESGALPRDEAVALIQHGIDNGWVWQLQGFYGRIANQLINAGICTRACNEPVTA